MQAWCRWGSRMQVGTMQALWPVGELGKSANPFAATVEQDSVTEYWHDGINDSDDFLDSIHTALYLACLGRSSPYGKGRVAHRYGVTECQRQIEFHAAFTPTIYP